MIPDYNHLIEINEEKRQLVIYRVYRNDRRELFTSVELLIQSAYEKNNDQFKKFCCLLGENLLIDSLVARKLLALE